MQDRIIKQRIFFFGMIAILAILALVLVWQFISAILLAAALVIILKPVYNWLLNKRWINGSASRATAATMLIFILIIAIPAVMIIGGAISQATQLFRGLDIEGLDFSLREMNLWLEKTIQTRNRAT